MVIRQLQPTDSEFPDALRHIPSPPKLLYVLSENLSDLLTAPKVAIVGSRRVSAYGRTVTERFARELAGQGAVIISGLAIGVDGFAHDACLAAGGRTIAVMPAGLDAVYPRRHTQLARRILQQGGALISEYPAGMPALKQNFIARNRLVAGLSDCLLITEAVEKSGSLHTARFALEQGREVLAVPGNITSPGSVGTNNLIRAGAHPATCSDDVRHILGLQSDTQIELPLAAGKEEQAICRLLAAGISDANALQAQSGLQAAAFSQVLTMLEITGRVYALGNNHWSLRR